MINLDSVRRRQEIGLKQTVPAKVSIALMIINQFLSTDISIGDSLSTVCFFEYRSMIFLLFLLFQVPIRTKIDFLVAIDRHWWLNNRLYALEVLAICFVQPIIYGDIFPSDTNPACLCM